MKEAFLDTNLFIRYFTNDDPRKADRVERLLEDAARGRVRLVTADLVIAEIVWVLESAYELTCKEIAPMVDSILSTPGITVSNGEIVSRAIRIYEEQGVDFVDAFVVATMEKLNIQDLFSYDRKHLSKVPRIRRVEP